MSSMVSLAYNSRIWKTKVGGSGVQGQQVPGWPKLQETLSQEMLSSPLPKSNVYSGLTNIFKNTFYKDRNRETSQFNKSLASARCHWNESGQVLRTPVKNRSH